jgi:hypothetical protein
MNASAPVGHRELFEDIARDYLATVLPRFDHARSPRVEHATTDRSRFPARFHPRSLEDPPELANPAASDTAVVTGWWSETPAERVALALERHLNRRRRARYSVSRSRYCRQPRAGDSSGRMTNVMAKSLARYSVSIWRSTLAKCVQQVARSRPPSRAQASATTSLAQKLKRPSTCRTWHRRRSEAILSEDCPDDFPALHPIGPPARAQRAHYGEPSPEPVLGIWRVRSDGHLSARVAHHDR